MKSNNDIKRNKFWKVIIFSIISFVIVFIFSVSIGSSYIPFMDIIKILLDLEYNSLETQKIIVNNIRLPRVIMSFLVGSGLAIAGVIFQGIIRNPMADPYIVGISAGAGTGVTIAIVLGINFTIFGMGTLPIMAFVGAILTVYAVYNLARVNNKVPVMTFLLAGVAVGYVLNAFTSFLMVIGSNELHQIVYWLMGSISNSNWQEIQMILPYYIIGLLPVSFFLNDLNIILLGEENAQYLGVDVEKVKLILIVSATLITASVVSVSGNIGFVGLIIPHITRMLVGPDHRKLLPFAAIFGGIFMMISDDLARILLSPLEIPVGIITSLAGGPYFIYLLRKKKNSSW